MATYTASSYFRYEFDSGTTYNFLSQDFSPTYTYDDLEADTTFEVGDDINSNTVTATFLGTVELTLAGGATTVAMVAEMSTVPSSQRILILSENVDPANVTLPASIDLNTLNTSDFTTCFATGTQIATPIHDRTVEDLHIGDLILTADGRQVAVKWIGRQTILKQFRGDRARLVRIRKGALGGGLPASDLTVTADHGMVLDGLVINASALVNGHGIDWVPLSDLSDCFTVYHIETAAHDVILANGAAAETYIDYVARSSFDNHAEYLALYGVEASIPEMPLPRISAARMVPAPLRARLSGQVTDAA
ncbi:Hint domain-containing protein [Antarctobacter heliothermus]|uniref:Hint domain-containing protein n=1 Tax=Antarctobacter heliothermus TaxID=74033 RepID=A0A239HE83_9RHOB|nr:Hint domain-containing protein [Antarctobacter heliothermus]SNS79729.1 Hint domain-containing protein [Antarctobacter heliothermus]